MATIFISDLNPIQFSLITNLPVGKNPDIFSNRFELRNQRSVYFSNAYYHQKWQKATAIPLQIITEGYGLLAIKLVDAQGNQVGATQPFTLVSNTAVQAPYITQSVIVDLSLQPDGIYSLIILDGAVELFASEWINLRVDFPNCLKFDYQHTTNIFNTYWLPSFQPSIFVEAIFNPIQPGTESENFIDSLHDVYQLNSRTFDKQMLILGGNSGLPDYLSRKLNILLNLNRVSVEGVRWSKATPEALVPLVTEVSTPMQCWSIIMSPSIAVTGLNFNGTAVVNQGIQVYSLNTAALGVDNGVVQNIEVVNP